MLVLAVCNVALIAMCWALIIALEEKTDAVD